MGPNTDGVMSALIASLSFDREYVALGVFSDWGEQAAKAVPAIFEVLKTENNPSALGVRYSL